jgi:prephenate dehydrogenase
MQPFEQISIIGVGLLGGSLGLACKSQGLAKRVVGYGRSRDNLEKARKLNAIDDYSADLNDAVKGADLIVLCTPVCSFKALVEKMLPFVKPGTILTDVGSVKAQVVREIESLVPRTIYFVGAHPIAGREKSGVSAAEKDLYRGAKCHVTPTSGTDKTALARVVSRWEALGMKVSTMDVEEHDNILGAVSQLPHSDCPH